MPTLDQLLLQDLSDSSAAECGEYRQVARAIAQDWRRAYRLLSIGTAREFFHTIADNGRELRNLFTQCRIFGNVALNATIGIL
jgi:hypothetical protein